MLKLDQLSLSYGAFRLGPLGLSVGREVVAVLGPSGCGKTTLLKLVAGLASADDGAVSLNGKDLDGLPPEERGTRLVFQEGAVFPHLSARRNIAYAAPSPEAIEPLAERLEISGLLDRPGRTLSGGERRRVEVARALAADPAVLLLDEPTTGLDAPIRQRLRRRLRAVFSDLALPVLYVTHDQDEAAAVADRIAVMRAGAIHQIGPPAEVFEHPATPFVASFTGNPNVLPVRLLQKGPRPLVDWDGRHLHVAAVADGLDPGDAAWCCIRPEQISLDPPEEDASVNVFEATLDGHIFEGGAYVLTAALAGNDAPHRTLEVKVLLPTLRRLDAPARVRVHLAPETLHLMHRTSDGNRRLTNTCQLSKT